MRFSNRRTSRKIKGFAKHAGICTVFLTALAVTGCQSEKKADPLAGGGGLAGRWVSADSVFTAEFRDGSFVSTANDTGETLSTGSYIVLSVSEVRLEWVGNLSKQQNAATCQRPSVDVLNCTDQAGRTFSLRKTG